MSSCGLIVGLVATWLSEPVNSVIAGVNTTVSCKDFSKLADRVLHLKSGIIDTYFNVTCLPVVSEI